MPEAARGRQVPVGMTAFGRRGALLVAVAVVVCCPLAIGMWAMWHLRPIAELTQAADVIVVLGGETNQRVGEAALLFAAGQGRHVLVSGAGDCLQNRDRLMAAGVPSAAITVECQSTTTRDNAQRSDAIIRALGARRVIIVTSWFHAARAWTCFQAFGRDIAFFSAPVYEDQGLDWLLEDSRRVASEYLKFGWYLARYGIVAQAAARQETLDSAEPSAPTPSR